MRSWTAFIPVARAISPGGEVVAIDIQQGMIRRAQQKAEAAGISSIRFIHGGVAETELDRSEMIGRCLLRCWGKFRIKPRRVRVIFDALKVKSIFSITELIFDPHFQSRKKILGLASQAGLGEGFLWQQSCLHSKSRKTLWHPNPARLTARQSAKVIIK